MRHGGRYLMYYSIPPYAPEIAPANAAKGWGIGIAESMDLTHWKKVGEVLPEQPCEANGICAPGARVLGGRIHLFYQTYGNGPKDALCHAVSDDGIHFRRNPTNPIFAPPINAWSNGRAIDADVVPWKEQLLLFYSTRDPEGKIQMGGVAAAALGAGADRDYGKTTWKPLGTGPTLRPELPWEKKCIEASAMGVHNGRLYMFYAGGYNNEPQQVGCAVCEGDDPTRWRRLSDQPLLPNGKPGEWNASESGHPFLFQDEDGTDHLFFQGNNDNGKTWYLSRKRVLWEATGPRLVEP